VLFACSLLMIAGGWQTDVAGIVPAVLIAIWMWRKSPRGPEAAPRAG
jgi:hypothetical protein